MSLVLHGRECSIWGCRPKPHPSLRSLVATRCFKSLGFRYAPVVFLRATQKRYVLNARPARRCIPAAIVLRAFLKLASGFAYCSNSGALRCFYVHHQKRQCI